MSGQHLYEQPQPTNYMAVLGGIILAGVAIYAVFMGINSFGLPEKQGIAVITEKGYREAGKTYTTQKIGNQMLTVPQNTPEMYILKGKIDGKDIEFPTSKALYKATDIGDKISVTYIQKRITGSLQIVDVKP